MTLYLFASDRSQDHSDPSLNFTETTHISSEGFKIIILTFPQAVTKSKYPLHSHHQPLDGLRGQPS